MSNSIYQSEKFFGDVAPQRRVPNPNPITFPALLTGYHLIQDTNNPGQNTDNPSRRFYYTWEEVGINATPTGYTYRTFNGARVSGAAPGAEDFIPGINGAEVGQPTYRASSHLGVNLDLYPQSVAVMPAIHRNSPVSDAGVVSTPINDGQGPLVMLTILRTKIDLNEDGFPSPSTQYKQVGMFYSASKIDGICDTL